MNAPLHAPISSMYSARDIAIVKIIFHTRNKNRFLAIIFSLRDSVLH